MPVCIPENTFLKSAMCYSSSYISSKVMLWANMMEQDDMKQEMLKLANEQRDDVALGMLMASIWSKNYKTEGGPMVSRAR